MRVRGRVRRVRVRVRVSEGEGEGEREGEGEESKGEGGSEMKGWNRRQATKTLLCHIPSQRGPMEPIPESPPPGQIECWLCLVSNNSVEALHHLLQDRFFSLQSQLFLHLLSDILTAHK